MSRVEGRKEIRANYGPRSGLISVSSAFILHLPFTSNTIHSSPIQLNPSVAVCFIHYASMAGHCSILPAGFGRCARRRRVGLGLY